MVFTIRKLWKQNRTFRVNIFISVKIFIYFSEHQGRVHSKKKNYCEFSQLEGGVRTNFPHFLNFFIFIFSCANSFKSAVNFYFPRGGVPPSDHQNLENIHNMDPICGIFQVFHGIFFSSAENNFQVIREKNKFWSFLTFFFYFE